MALAPHVYRYGLPISTHKKSAYNLDGVSNSLSAEKKCLLEVALFHILRLPRARDLYTSLITPCKTAVKFMSKDAALMLSCG